MSIITNLLVAAPMLQDYLVDKDGTPMAFGTITCYHDNSRTTLKNWYYQSGTPGNYTYIPLPNPLTLSAAGTICDINGVDTIPFFYPWLETDPDQPDPYYITIVNYLETNQITRANFPFMGVSGSGTVTTEANLNNVIINSGFWRNIAPNATTAASYATFTYNSTNMPVPSGGTIPAIIVAPSQHDGFRMPDIQFQKTNFSGTDVVTFTPFPLSLSQPIANNIVPEYYINHVSGIGSAVTQKCYQFPISLHVNTLANVPFTFSIMAQNDPTTGSTTGGGNVINIYIVQDTGTGGSAVPIGMPLTTISLNSTWQLYTATGVFPSTAGLILGNGADDALYVQVQLPLNVACGINFTNPSIYLTQNAIIPANNFQTYDQVDAIINSPRTGDIRTSLNSFYYFGWLPMNNGTIGNSSSNATARANADTWQLFNLIWNACAQFSAPSSGTSNPLAQMYTSTGTPVGYGPNITTPTTAYSDFNAGNQLTITSAMGNVILGTVPLGALISPYTQVVSSLGTYNSQLQFTIASNANLFVGQPVTFVVSGTFPSGINGITIYYVTNLNANSTTNTFQIASSFANAVAGTATGGTNLGSYTTLTANFQQTASNEGEYAHTQLMVELATHTHTGSVAVGVGSFSTTGPGIYGQVTAGPTGLTINNTGSSFPFNVTQPATFYNMFMKL